MKKILVIGSSNVDYTARVEHFPLRGQTLMAKSYDTNLGGKGLNQAIAAKLFYDEVTFLTALGNDNNKDYILNELKKYNLNVKPIIKEAPTGSAFILVEDKTGENEIIVNGGANVLLNKEDIDNNIDLIKESDYILLQLEVPVDVIKHIVDIAYDLNKVIVLNPAPYHTINKDILSKLTYITPNEIELQLLTENHDDYHKNAHLLLDKGVKNVIVTLGSKGSMLFNKDNEVLIDSYKVNAIDTTGAGDCYNGTFLACIASGYSDKEALEYASIASALSVTKHGAARSYSSKDEIMKLKK